MKEDKAAEKLWQEYNRPDARRERKRVLKGNFFSTEEIGRIAKIVGMVDGVLEWDDFLNDRPSRWGTPPQSHFQKKPETLEEYRSDLLQFLGGILFQAIEERDSKLLRKFARVLDEGKKQSFLWHDWPFATWPSDHKKTFKLETLRAFETLKIEWLIFEKPIPTKRQLRELVEERWEGIVIQREFSRTLKELGLNGLPHASSRRTS